MAVDYTDRIAALQDALATGALSVSYEGKSVTYRSTAEMQSLVAYLQRAQARANGGRVANVGLASFGRGYSTRGGCGR